MLYHAVGLVCLNPIVLSFLCFFFPKRILFLRSCYRVSLLRYCEIEMASVTIAKSYFDALLRRYASSLCSRAASLLWWWAWTTHHHHFSENKLT
jgi:hypothetical protein